MSIENDTVPEGMARIQCITTLSVWADVLGKSGQTVSRPLVLDEVAIIPRDQALERMKKNRHVVEIR